MRFFNRSTPNEQPEPEPTPSTPTPTPRPPADHVSRERLLLQAEQDVDVLGWDKSPRLWVVRRDETSGEEYLDLVSGEIVGHPLEWIKHMVTHHGPLDGDEVQGMVLCTEGYTYPDALLRQVQGMSPDEATRFLSNHGLPSEHPERQEMRSLVMVDRNTRLVTAVMRVRGQEPQVDSDINATGQIADALLNAMGLPNNSQADFAAKLACHVRAGLSSGLLPQLFDDEGHDHRH